MNFNFEAAIAENTALIISEADLTVFWKEISFGDNGIDGQFGKLAFLDAFKATWKDADGSLALNTGGWRVKLLPGLIKSSICGPATYGILTYLGVTAGIAGTIVPLIIPLLFDIENIKLDKKDETIYLNLPAKKFTNQFRSDQEWYNSLGDEIRKDISYLDFKNFMDKLFQGGLALKNQNEKYSVFKKGDGMFKLSFE